MTKFVEQQDYFMTTAKQYGSKLQKANIHITDMLPDLPKCNTHQNYIIHN